MLRFNKPLRRAFSAALAPLWVFLAQPCVAQAMLPDNARADPRPVPAIALMGTIPVYWGEAAGIDEIISGDAPPHWARAVLERTARLVPIDYLSAEALGDHDFLLLAQPRGLTAEENVALDGWVRGGGRLLAFVDPWMTGESRFGIGDRRRPQDVALLSPILAHWGLELMIDAAQAEGVLLVEEGGHLLPVNMRGAWAARGAAQPCALGKQALLAHCQIGQGRALLVADAAMLDLAGPHAGAEAGFESLLAQIFPQTGESAGTDAILPLQSAPETENRLISGIGTARGRAILYEGDSNPP